MQTFLSVSSCPKKIWYSVTKRMGGMDWKVRGTFKRERTYVYPWPIRVDVWQKPWGEIQRKSPREWNHLVMGAFCPSLPIFPDALNLCGRARGLAAMITQEVTLKIKSYAWEQTYRKIEGTWVPDDNRTTPNCPGEKNKSCLFLLLFKIFGDRQA